MFNYYTIAEISRGYGLVCVEKTSIFENFLRKFLLRKKWNKVLRLNFNVILEIEFVILWMLDYMRDLCIYIYLLRIFFHRGF